jgi:hypothetical protein
VTFTEAAPAADVVAVYAFALKVKLIVTPESAVPVLVSVALRVADALRDPVVEHV